MRYVKHSIPFNKKSWYFVHAALRHKTDTSDVLFCTVGAISYVTIFSMLYGRRKYMMEIT